jgi:hypothetical protein
MRETRPSGSEGGGTDLKRSSLPLSITRPLRGRSGGVRRVSGRSGPILAALRGRFSSFLPNALTLQQHFVSDRFMPLTP